MASPTRATSSPNSASWYSATTERAALRSDLPDTSPRLLTGSCLAAAKREDPVGTSSMRHYARDRPGRSAANSRRHRRDDAGCVNARLSAANPSCGPRANVAVRRRSWWWRLRNEWVSAGRRLYEVHESAIREGRCYLLGAQSTPLSSSRWCNSMGAKPGKLLEGLRGRTALTRGSHRRGCIASKLHPSTRQSAGD